MQGKSSPPGVEGRISRIAARQYGVVSRAQLLRIGLSEGAIEHRLRSGRLLRVRRGVYSVGVTLPSREGRWAAAVLACSPGAVVSHLSASALWMLRAVDPVVIDVSVCDRGMRRRDGIRVHRPRALCPEDVTRHRGLPVTTVPRTLIDLAEVLCTRSLERAVDEAEFLKLLKEAPLHAALDRNAGRTGAKRLRALLRRHQPGTTRTRSQLEEDFFVLLRSAGLPQPDVNEEVGPFTVELRHEVAQV